MRAVMLTGFGGFEQLAFRTDVAVPKPAAGELLIKVGAAAVNNTDINTRIGWYSSAVDGATAAGSEIGFAETGGEGWSGTPFSFPRIQGIDAVGRVVAVGAGVDIARLGERVLVEPCFRADDGSLAYFGSERDGGFADYAAVPARHAHKIVSDLSDVELAGFPCAFLTAETMIERIGLSAGEHVLITGASGGVGSAAIQLARRRGAHVVAMAGAAKHAELQGLGAEVLLDRDARLSDDSIDAVIDVVGGDRFPALLAMLRRGGRYAVAGAIAGPLVTLDLRILYLKDLSFHGCTVPPPGLFSQLVGIIERGEIKPQVSAIYPLDAMIDAQRAFLSKAHIGKIIIEI